MSLTFTKVTVFGKSHLVTSSSETMSQKYGRTIEEDSESQPATQLVTVKTDVNTREIREIAEDTPSLDEEPQEDEEVITSSYDMREIQQDMVDVKQIYSDKPKAYSNSPVGKKIKNVKGAYTTESEADDEVEPRSEDEEVLQATQRVDQIELIEPKKEKLVEPKKEGKPKADKKQSKKNDSGQGETKEQSKGTRKPKQREIKDVKKEQKQKRRRADAIYNEIVKAQKDTDIKMNKTAVRRIVREIARDTCEIYGNTEMRFQKKAFVCIQTGAEQFIHKVFRNAIKFLKYKERQTLDIQTLLLALETHPFADSLKDYLDDMRERVAVEKKRRGELYSKRKSSTPKKSTNADKEKEFSHSKGPVSTMEE